MKTHVLLLVLPLVLTACGGSDPEPGLFNGTVNGLISGNSLTIFTKVDTSWSEDPTVTANGPFVVHQTIGGSDARFVIGSHYRIKSLSLTPASPDTTQNCHVTKNGEGTITTDNTNVEITCAAHVASGS